MIVGSIQPWGKKYAHIETGIPIEIVNTDVQVKINEPNFGPNQWVTGVVYARKGEPEWFVIDVDSFRRKFKEIAEVEA